MAILTSWRTEEQEGKKERKKEKSERELAKEEAIHHVRDQLASEQGRRRRNHIKTQVELLLARLTGLQYILYSACLWIPPVAFDCTEMEAKEVKALKLKTLPSGNITKLEEPKETQCIYTNESHSIYRGGRLIMNKWVLQCIDVCISVIMQ